MIVRRTTISELENSPNIHDLLKEYAAESSVKGLPKPNAKVELYRAIEGSGQIVMLGTWANGELIGFAAVINTVLPHYGIIVSVMESLFVTAERRNTGAGLGLIRLAEKIAASVNSPGLLVSAPAGGVLEQILPRVGYGITNTAWFKSLSAVPAARARVDEEVLSGTAVLLTEQSPVEGVC